MIRHDLVDDILSISDELPDPLTDESDTMTAVDKTDTIPELSDDDLFDASGDDVSRSVLLACNRAPMIAEELVESCEASGSTIYRQLETLSGFGLVEWAQRVGAPSRTCYETAVDSLSIHLGDGLRVEAGSSDYIVDAMRMPLAVVNVQQLAYDRE